MLETNIGPLSLRNPVLLAAGAYSVGASSLLKNKVTAPIIRRVLLKSLGAIVTKTITLKPKEGNPEPRVVRTTAGVLNSVGLENPGCDNFLNEVLPLLEGINVPVIVSITGDTLEDLKELTTKIKNDGRIAGIELNLSCPNIQVQDRAQSWIAQQIRTVVNACSLPVIVKVGPVLYLPVQNLTKIAAQEGAAAITVSNTYPGMAIDIRTRRPKLGGITGGLSGPAIKPLSLLAVYQASQTNSLPVIGCGGIRTGKDAIEFLLAGAKAIQVGSACLSNPMAPLRVKYEIAYYCLRNGTQVQRLHSLFRTVTGED